MHNTVGVIYLISCNKCSKQYVGQTFRKFRIRINEHIYDIKNQKDTVCSDHFNSRGHSLDNLRVQIIEKVMPNETHTLLKREKLWIQTLITRAPFGLNCHDQKNKLFVSQLLLKSSLFIFCANLLKSSSFILQNLNMYMHSHFLSPIQLDYLLLLQCKSISTF